VEELKVASLGYAPSLDVKLVLFIPYLAISIFEIHISTFSYFGEN
jgi:hypothetical protein